MNEAHQILFEKYISGRLNEAETTDFEARLNSDPSFKEDYELFQTMDAHSSEKSRNKSALDALNEVHEEETDNLHDNIASAVKTQKGFNFKLYLIILAVLGAIAFFAYKKLMKTSGESVLYAEIMENHYELPANRGTRSLSPNSTKLDSAVYYFDLRDFDTSQQLFEDLDATFKERIFYLSHIHFLKQDYKACIRWIDGQIPSFITDDLIELKVYCYLLMGKEDEAQKTVSELPEIKRNKLNNFFPN